MKTTLFRGGKLVDGSGGQARDAHVLRDGERIKAVLGSGEVLPEADSVIDTTGCIVAPGFIDAHSHMDWFLPLEDHPLTLKSFLEQGVTTVVAGNCGFSPAPVEARHPCRCWTAGQLLPCRETAGLQPGAQWESSATALQERKPVLNLAQLVGHADHQDSGGEHASGSYEA